MEMLNLDHLVTIKNSSYNDIEINSFNLIEGDWVYLSGDTSIADLIYELLTAQIKVTNGEMKIFGYDSVELSQEQLLEIRQSISCLPNDISSPETNKSIINSLSLVKAIKASEGLRIFNQLKSEIIYNENLIDTNEVKNILKALSTKPKVLFVDFSFDKFDNGGTVGSFPKFFFKLISLRCLINFVLRVPLLNSSIKTLKFLKDQFFTAFKNILLWVLINRKRF